MNKVNFTEDQIQKIISLYQSGISCKKIAPDFNVSWGVINRLLHQYHIERILDNQHKKTPLELEKEIINLYLNLMPSNHIAEKLNISKHTILAILERNNIQTRSNAEARALWRKKPFIEKDIIIDLYINKKLKRTVIQNKFGIGRDTLDRWLKYYNISKRTHKEERGILLEEQKHIKNAKINVRDKITSSLYYWKKSIKERDNYICQKCSSKENIEVHHLKPLRIIIREFRNRHKQLDFYDEKNCDFIINSILTMHSLSVGVTLCKNCHCEVGPDRAYYKDK